MAALPRTSLVVLSALLAAASLQAQVQKNGGLPTPLPLFPVNNPWNRDVSAWPVDPNSGAYINFIGTGVGLHPDFGGDDTQNPPAIYGMVYMTVSGTQALEQVTFVDYGSQSDSGAPGRPAGYPIPVQARTEDKWIEGGYPANSPLAPPSDGDRHLLLVDRDNRLLFELWHTRWNTALARWEAGSGAAWSLNSNALRPDGWTSADAAGLQILPGLVRYDEVFGTDPLKHALRFTVGATNGYVWPGSHDAGSTSGALPMGARLRLKSGVDISAHPAYIQKIFQAMKTYGLIVADNGSDMYIQGTWDTNWDNGQLNPAFGALHASDFEVLSLGVGRPWESIGDFDRDLSADPAVYHAATGLWYLRLSTTGATQSVAYGGAGYTPVARDYDGDARTDVAVYHAASGLWYVRQSSTGSTLAVGYGGPGYTPVARDYDGDGKVDIGVYHAATGLWFVRRSSTSTTFSVGYGGSGYTPVPADYDGDGKADVAVYHAATGLWFIRQSSTGSTQTLGFGGSGYTPVPTDYDGDNRTDMAVYHQASGLWFIRRSSTGTTLTLAFGGSGFVPANQ